MLKIKKNTRTIEVQSLEPAYSGFHARSVALLIDCFIAAIIFMPLFYLFDNIIFGKVSPSDIIEIVTTKGLELKDANPESFNMQSYILNNELLHEYFVTDNGYIKIAISRILQLGILLPTFLLFWIKKQATPGKMALSLKIVDATTLKKPTRKQLIIRMLSYIVSIAPFFLGMIWIAIDRRKQGWHDKIANTLVIKEKTIKNKKVAKNAT